MKIFIVDAFSNAKFGGNQAGVVLLNEFPEDEKMRLLANELRYSETAFVKKLNENEFHIRYFTPAAEVDLCGHATIASFKVLLSEGIVKDNSKSLLHTLSGDLNIEINNGYVLMDMASPKKLNEITEENKLVELYKIMGLDYLNLKNKGLNLIPQMISTGLPDIMMPVNTIDDLNNINPDFKALSALSDSYKVVGVHAFTLEDMPNVHVRNFAPLYDIDEEAATGTSNGALTYYLKINDIIPDNSNCVFIQGEKMNRASEIRSKINGDKIMVGGDAVILVKGEIDL